MWCTFIIHLFWSQFHHVWYFQVSDSSINVPTITWNHYYHKIACSSLNWFLNYSKTRLFYRYKGFWSQWNQLATLRDVSIDLWLAAFDGLFYRTSPSLWFWSQTNPYWRINNRDYYLINYEDIVGWGATTSYLRLMNFSCRHCYQLQKTLMNECFMIENEWEWGRPRGHHWYCM